MTINSYMKVGDNVTHGRWGNGIIENLTGNGIAEVKFKGGIKFVEQNNLLNIAAKKRKYEQEEIQRKKKQYEEKVKREYDKYLTELRMKLRKSISIADKWYNDKCSSIISRNVYEREKEIRLEELEKDRSLNETKKEAERQRERQRQIDLEHAKIKNSLLEKIRIKFSNNFFDSNDYFYSNSDNIKYISSGEFESEKIDFVRRWIEKKYCS